MKQIFNTKASILVMLLLAAFQLCLTSCSKDDKATGTPTITGVRVCDPAKADSLFTESLQGQVVAIIGQNLADVQKVYVNNQSVYFNPTYNTDHSVIITIPDEDDGFELATEENKLPEEIRIETSHGTATYAFKVLPDPTTETTLWEGSVDLGTWSINWCFGENKASSNESASLFTDADIQEGQTIRVYATKSTDNWQIQFFDGHWAGQTEIGNATHLNNGNNINSGIYDLDGNNGAIVIPVTATLKEQLTTLTDWGYCWIIQGQDLVITKITIE